MTWRHANAIIAAVSAVILLISVVLWSIAWIYDFIGSTDFIGHVSMVALVLGAASMLMAAIAAWRADVPSG